MNFSRMLMRNKNKKKNNNNNKLKEKMQKKMLKKKQLFKKLSQIYKVILIFRNEYLIISLRLKTR